RRAPRARGVPARVPLCATGAAARAGRALVRLPGEQARMPLDGRDVPPPPRHVGGDRGMTGPPVLWHFPISHYNEKARWALDWKGIPHVRRALALSYVPRALWATGQAKLPILFLDGQTIADSTRIIEALERLRPEPALHPPDEAARRPRPYRGGAGALGPSRGRRVQRRGPDRRRAPLADRAPAGVHISTTRAAPQHLTALRASLEGHPAFRWVLEIYRQHRGTSAA